MPDREKDPELRKRRLAAAGIAAAAIAAYANSFPNAFVYPHLADIFDNPTIRRLGRLGSVLNPPSTGGMTVGGRPIVNLSLALNYALGGTAPWSYHAFNLLVHIAAGLTLFGIVRRTLERIGAGRPGRPAAGSVPFAFAAALLWTLHPLQTESVTYVIERAESLTGLFYLLTLYAFIRSAEPVVEAAASPLPRSGRLWSAVAVLSCYLGMATKEVMATAPVIVLLYDGVFVSGGILQALKRRKGFYAALASSWLLVAWLALGTAERGGTAGFQTVRWWTYAETQFGAILHYLRLAAWPQPLIFDYGAQWVKNPAAVVVPALLILALLGASAASFARGGGRPGLGGRTAGFLGLAFLALLAPTSLVPIVVQTMAEHRTYLALAPLAIGFVSVLAALLHRLGRPGLLLPLVFLIAAAFLLRTAARNADYRNNLTLWGLTAAQEPDNPRAHYYHGVGLDEAGRSAEAMGEFETALGLKPDYAEAHNRLAIDLLGAGALDQALSHYAAAIRIQPGFALAHYNLGTALAQAGRLPEGEAELREALRLDPGNAQAHNNLGLTLAGMGRFAEAIAEYREALRLEPQFALAEGNLAKALEAAGSPGNRR